MKTKSFNGQTAAMMGRRSLQIAPRAGLFALLFTSITLLFVYFLLGCSPFGDGCIAYRDGAIQYIDFLTWGKELLSGHSSIGFDFSSYLGTDTTATFAYYLASPLNLLLLFSPEEKIPVVINFIILIKLSFSSAMMSYYLAKRFNIDASRVWITTCLGLSYGLCQWSVVQSSCIMWLDAFCLAPLVLLSVYYLVRSKSMWFYSLLVGLTLCFNWYMGMVVCLFSGVWVVFEFVLFHLCKETKSIEYIKQLSLTLFRFLVAFLVGASLSAFLLIPTFLLLEASARGAISVSLIENLRFGRNVFSCLSNYTLGATSSFSTAALFSGSLPAIGAIGAVFASKFRWSKKLILGVLVFIGVLIICWSPLVSLFCLFQKEETYLVRYSFIFSLILIFVGATFYLERGSGFQEKNVSIKLFWWVVIFLFLQTILFAAAPNYVTGLLSATVIFSFFITLVCVFYQQLKTAGIVFLCALCLFESGANSFFILDNDFHVLNLSSSRESYVSEEKDMISAIGREAGPQPYRIYATRPWDDPDQNPSFATNQNEPLAFSFNGLTGYSSIANKNQLEFLSHMGENRAHVIASAKQPILPLASMLSARYIISSCDISLLHKTNIEAPYAQIVYENQFALPFMFGISQSTDLTFDYSNPFKYTNQVFEQLCGIQDPIYQQASSSLVSRTNNQVDYMVSCSSSHSLLYGMIPNVDAEVYVDGKHYVDIKKDWVSTRLFYIPISPDRSSVKVTISSKESQDIVEPIFQQCNIDVMEKCVQVAKTHEVKVEAFSDNHIEAVVDSDLAKKIFISIPVQDGWTFRVNGKEVKPEKIFDCFYLLPIEKGPNRIVLQYNTPGMKSGWAVTVFGITSLVFEYLFEKRAKKAQSV